MDIRTTLILPDICLGIPGLETITLETMESGIHLGSRLPSIMCLVLRYIILIGAERWEAFETTVNTIQLTKLLGLGQRENVKIARRWDKQINECGLQFLVNWSPHFQPTYSSLYVRLTQGCFNDINDSCACMSVSIWIGRFAHCIIFFLII